ncbi:MAG TPA: tRNA (adenosine(37)-N6)-threonylcarbamoyltransferase complex dimerization subunit type 1 TsaB [Candidatus Acidoferrales bacterium]|nr:tRNA (adenosine(37)-N6)-threonylcarbamoyltransferase complex dimerization subunit type 1 TsaB [Candidatus Acidoferrales bacterium]
MRRILAIETATKVCSVAVADECEVLGEFSLFVPQVHAERLIVMTSNLIENLRLTYSDLDAVAVSIGPGSFTGLRIGLSVAKGIAYGQDKKLIAIPTLEAIARLLRDRAGPEKTIVPVLRARADEFYYSSFLVKNSELKMRTGYGIADADSIIAEFSSETFFIGEGAVELSKHEGAKKKFGAGRFIDIPASAKEVALAAQVKLEREEFDDVESLVPMYLKDFIAIKGKSFPNGIHLDNKLLEKI